jgi:hypothetical protein
MMAAPTVRCDRDGPGGGADVTADTDRRSADAEGGARIICARCEHTVTSAAARIHIDDKHEHVGVNPHGFGYRFGCFAEAPGCVVRGTPSSYWSWFPGTSWQIADCGGCGRHLGWWFRGERATFYGLILDRIAEME